MFVHTHSATAHPRTSGPGRVDREAVTSASFTFVDLFAGIGGFHLAMQQLGGECVFVSEIDPACQTVYEANFGMLPEGDIRPLTEGDVMAVPPHDVLCAGFPCQPFSKSGHQRGMNETRGTLLFNILRILQARKPRFVVLENVRNLAGPRQTPAWETITYSLRSLGYQVADRPAVFSPHLLSEEDGGRPQVRERVFILAEYMGDDRAWQVPEPLIARAPVGGWNPQHWSIMDWLQSDDEIDELHRYRLKAHEIRWIDAWDVFVQRLSMREDLPGHPIWVDAFRKTAATYTWLPSWKKNFLGKNAGLYRRNIDWIPSWIRKHNVKSFPPSRRKFEWQARGYDPDLWQLVLHLRPSGIRVKGPTYLPALVAITQTSVIGSHRRRITPREAARLQGLPEDFRLHPVDAVAYKQLGNAVNVGAVRYVASRLFDSSEVGWPGTLMAKTCVAAS